MSLKRLPVVLLLLTVATSVPAHAEPTDAVTYRIRTRAGSGGSCNPATERVMTAVAGAPTPVDAVASIPGAELLVQLAATPPVATSPTTIRLIVNRLTPTPVPLLVEAILVDPATAGRRAAFGYDACATGAPLNVQATALIAPANVTLDVNTTNASPRLTLIGSLFQEVRTTRVNPENVSAAFSPVPARITASLQRLGSDRYAANLVTSQRAEVTLAYERTDASGTSSLSSTLDQFPGSLRLVAGSDSVDYQASGVVGRLTIAASDTPRTGTATSAFVSASDMPTEARLIKDGTTSARLIAAQPIGEVTAAFAWRPVGTYPPLVIAPAGDYLYVRRQGSAGDVRLRLRRISSASVGWGDPVFVELTHAGGPFTIFGNLDGKALTGSVRDLPPRLRLEYHAAAQRIVYSGSAVIGEIRASLTSPTPIFGRVREAHLLARNVPTSLNLALAPAGNAFVFDANGATLGLLEVRFTSGPDDSLPAGQDGVLYRDLNDRFVVFGRITGLKHVRVDDFRRATGATSGSRAWYVTGKQVRVVTAGNREFRAVVHKANPAKPGGYESSTTTVQSLPEDLTVQMLEHSLYSDSTGDDVRYSELVYEANRATPSLSYESNAGDHSVMRASVAPLPTRVRVCTSPEDRYCSGLSQAGEGSYSFEASSRTNAYLFDCKRPTTGCTTANDTESTEASLSVVKLALGAHKVSTGFNVWIDTDNNALTGWARVRKNDNTEQYVLLPNHPTRDFTAENRYVEVRCGLFSCSGDNPRGSIHCPSGTQFKIDTHHWRWGYADFAEEIC